MLLIDSFLLVLYCCCIFCRPGTYVISRRFGSPARNPKNIMVSTAPRDERIRIRAPPPGYYDPQPLTGTFIKPSHNILLSEKY